MNVPSFNLNGRWIDVNAVGCPEVTITHNLNANTVHAEYSEVRRCKERNETLLEETSFNFEGKLKGDRLEGKINVCNFGKNSSKNGWFLERLELTVSADGERLDGQFFCSVDRNWVLVTFIRKIPVRGGGQLKAAARQGQDSS